MARRRAGVGAAVTFTAVLTAVLTSAFWLAVGTRGYLPVQGPANPGGHPGARPDTGVSPVSPDSPADFHPPEPAERPVVSRSVGRIVIPVAGVEPEQLVDTFEESRGAGRRRHDAIDIVAPLGTPVLAARAGRVEKLFLSDAGGKTIYIRTLDGRRIHYYAHLDSYADGVEEGDIVEAGQQIGTVGHSGNASEAAPHLHFEIMATTMDRGWFEPATPINPYPLLVGG